MTDQPTPPAGDTPPTPMSRRDLEARIIANAWRDPKYRNALLKNPRAVLQRELSAIDPSIVLPAGLRVKVHEEAANTYHLVLPRNPKDISLHELVGDNLEAVAPQTIAVVVVNVGPVVSNATIMMDSVVVVSTTSQVIANAVLNVVA